MLRRLVTPWGAYSALRDQMGSIRGVYMGRNTIQRRDDMGNHDELVLLLHGFFQTRNVWEVMEDRLRHDGYGVMSFNLGGLARQFNTQPVDELAAMIAEKIERLSVKHHFERLHVIGHSKGGLIARRYVQHHGGHRRVKSVTTLGTPHHGTPTAFIAVGLMGMGLLDSSATQLLPGSGLVRKLAQDTFPAHIPLTSVYSTADLVCPYQYSVLRPRAGESSMSNIRIRGVGHTQLTHDAGVYLIVRQQLEHASTLWRERLGTDQAAPAR